MKKLQIKDAIVTIYPTGYAVIEGRTEDERYEMYEFLGMHELDYTNWQIAC